MNINNRASQKFRIVINVLSNYLTQFIYGISNFVLVGYVVRKLGGESFGLIALLISTIAITTLLERGISRALTKYVAEEVEKPGRPLLSKYVSTSFAWYVGVGLLGGIIMVVLAHFSSTIFKIPSHLQDDARIGWYLMGLRVALLFPFNSFQGVLHGYQRFDLVNLARNVAILLRLFGTIFFFELFFASIPALLWITILTLLVERILWILFANRVSDGIQLSVNNVSKKVFFVLFGFGIFVLINNVGNMLGYEAVKYVIGHSLSVTDVGGYTLIATVVMFAAMFVNAISSVLTPVASRLNSLGQHDNQQLLVRLSTKYVMILSGAVCILPIVLLRPALYFWVGDDYDSGYLDTLAVAGGILLVGQWFASTAISLLQMVTGVGRVKTLAMITMSWSVAGILSIILYLQFVEKSLFKVVVIITIFRIIGAIANFLFGLKVFKISVLPVLIQSIIKPLLVAVLMAMAVFGVSRYVDIFNLGYFLVVGFSAFAVYGLIIWFVAIGSDEKDEVRKQFFKIIRRKSGAN